MWNSEQQIRLIDEYIRILLIILSTRLIGFLEALALYILPLYSETVSYFNLFLFYNLMMKKSYLYPVLITNEYIQLRICITKTHIIFTLKLAKSCIEDRFLFILFKHTYKHSYQTFEIHCPVQ